ncbi:MAG: ATP-binding cassette domain-containing protein [Ilumatobacteraceae bacterium]
MPAPVVRLSGVRVTYPNGTRALDEVELSVRHGERVALVGPSGAGKSTLLNLLNGRVVIDGGRVDGAVEVFGEELQHLRGRARRRHANRIGVVRQDHDLVGPLRVIHNLNAGRLGTWSTWRAARSLVRPLDRQVDREVLISVGLDPELLDVRVDELSGGQRQRVALARVLRQRPDLVLADEPVASLDPEISALALGLITAPSDGVAPPDGWTSIVSLHQPEFARRFAERVIGVRDGRLLFDVAIADLTDDLLTLVYARP